MFPPDCSRRTLAAVVQAGPIAFNPRQTLEKMETLVAEAARQGAALVVFPEAFLPGYPKGCDFGARVGIRSPEGRVAFRHYFEQAVAVPGPVATALGQMARRHRVHLVVGVVEQAGDSLYCSVLFFADDGRYLGLHRKVMPTALERLIWGSGDASTLRVMATPLGRLGAVICWENYMPLLRTAMYAQRIELYCAPTVDDRPSWLPTMQHIAIEGRCFVLSACQWVRRSAYPADYAVELVGDAGADPVLIRGGSVIVDPFGTVLAGPVYDRECVLVAEIDRRRIAEGKYDLDVVGHYARPDLFQLQINDRPLASVGWSANVPATPEQRQGPADAQE